jgi:hypothetical protein
MTTKQKIRYFEYGLGLPEFKISAFLYPLWEKYTTTRGMYDFDSSNERYEACLKILKELKAE